MKQNLWHYTREYKTSSIHSSKQLSMPQHVFVIHGGNAFNSHAGYVASLTTKEVSLERLRAKGWKMTLGEHLGSDFEVFNPQMPCGQNAKYAEWKIIFDKLVPLMELGVILIGHSLGGIFLAKYLSEETFPKPITATLLVAPPFNTAGEYPLADFIFGDLSRLPTQAGKIFIYHSHDDQIVPFSNAEAYKNALPEAELVAFANRGHFNDDVFPELVQEILQVSTSHGSQ